MAISQATMVTKVRTRLSDKTTRRDGTAITTPRWSASDMNSAINDAIRSRSTEIAKLDPTFYLTLSDYTGQTDAVAASAGPPVITANEEYALPTGFREWKRLARRDLVTYPTVPLVSHAVQDSLRYRNWGLFDGFVAAYPENATSGNETVALVSHAGVTRFRIVPAPGATTYTYRLFFQRFPTEPGTNLDIPDEWQEVISYDAALLLAQDVNDETVPVLERGLARALQARYDDTRGRDAGSHCFGRVRF